MTEASWTRAEDVVELCGGNRQTVRERAQQRGVSPELVIYACQRALASAGPCDGALAPFDQWEVTPPGRLDVRVFDQQQYWIDALRIPHLISDRTDLTDEYLNALVKFLIEYAEHLHRGYLRYRPAPHREPGQWMESTVLMRSLRAEIARRAVESRSTR